MNRTLQNGLELSADEKRALLADLLQQKAAGPKPAPTSFAQRRLWFLDQLGSDSAAFNISKAVRMMGPLDLEALRETLNALVSRHESLRTNFELVDEEPVQVISPAAAADISLVDLRELPRDAREPELKRLLKQASRNVFDLAHDRLLRARLFQLDEREHVLLLTMHHIVSDGWSMGVLFAEIGALYQALVKGEAAPLADLPIQYSDFALWQRDWLQGEVLETQLNYWRKQLAGAPPVLELPTDRARPAIQTFNGAYHTTVLTKRLSQSLSELSRREGATLFMTLLAAFQTLLCRYTSQEDIVVGSPIANRRHAETEALIGFFVNTLVLRTDCSGNPSFRELLRRVREVALEAYAHQDLPFEKLVEELKPTRSLNHPPLFQVLFALQNAPKAILKLPALKLREIDLEGQTSKFDLSLYIGDTAAGLRLTFEYNTDLFNAATIGRMEQHFTTLLTAIVSTPEARLGKLTLLAEAERQQLLGEWTGRQTPYPFRCIHEFFQEQAAKTPDAVAAIFAEQQITFAELDGRANQLAHYLQERGVGPEVVVAVCLDRSITMVVALLGVLKAGGAFVPVDPSYPTERVAFLLSDSQAPIMLTQQRVHEALAEALVSTAETICLDSDWAEIARSSTEAPACSASPENAAYLIYTSGSTGTPKGSVSPHHASLNRCAWMWRTYPFAKGEVCCQKTSLSFVDSIWETFGPLLRGIPLVIIPDEAVKDPRQLIAALGTQGVTRLVLVPSLLRALLEHDPDLAQKLPRLKYWTCSGEALPLELARSFKQQLPEAVMLNLYGSSEIAADVTCYEVADPAQLAGIPIGRPIDNSAAYILDGCFEPVPAGVSGELYIAGAGLARSYFSHPDLTAERFLPSPFSKESGARMFRTGDVARYQQDGTIEFLGRRDYRVKIRGFRVELGEIEAMLMTHPAVKQVVTVLKQLSAESPVLVSYVVPAEHAVFEQSALSGALRGFLKTKLPEYLVPGVIVVLDAFPLTPSGKIDRRSLPAPDGARAELAVAYAAPHSAIEEVLAEIWRSLLGLERVGTADNFFDLGGYSLLLVKVHSRIREVLKTDLSVTDLFRYPTISSLARYLNAGQRDGSALQQVHDRARKQKEAMNRRRQLSKARSK